MCLLPGTCPQPPGAAELHGPGPSLALGFCPERVEQFPGTQGVAWVSQCLRLWVYLEALQGHLPTWGMRSGLSFFWGSLEDAGFGDPEGACCPLWASLLASSKLLVPGVPRGPGLQTHGGGGERGPPLLGPYPHFRLL